MKLVGDWPTAILTYRANSDPGSGGPHLHKQNFKYDWFLWLVVNGGGEGFEKVNDLDLETSWRLAKCCQQKIKPAKLGTFAKLIIDLLGTCRWKKVDLLKSFLKVTYQPCSVSRSLSYWNLKRQPISKQEIWFHHKINNMTFVQFSNMKNNET